MALDTKKLKGESQSGTQPQLEADVYPARLVQIIDLGLQAQRPYQGKEKAPAHEIMLTYELAYEFMKDKDGNDLEDKPIWLSETMPLYGLYADKAKSTLRYKAFDPEEVYEGDFSKCIGVPVNVTVVINKVGDKTYTNIGNVASMSAKKAANLPELVNDPRVFDLDIPDMEVFSALTQWLQDKIKTNLNFKGSALEKALGNSQPKAEAKVEQKVKAKVKPVDFDEEDAPF